MLSHLKKHPVNMFGLHLRPATLLDIPNAMLVALAARTAGFETGPNTLADFKEVVAEGNMVVVLVGDDLVGYSVMTSKANVCVVDPAWQGQGIRLAFEVNR